MSYYYSKRVIGTFKAVIDKVRAALKEEGFGVLTEIDVKATLKKKIDVEFKPYIILGACNPAFAYKALSAEDKIGAMLPCNVIVIDQGDAIEVAAVEPAASMMAVENEALDSIAKKVTEKLHQAIDTL